MKAAFAAILVVVPAIASGPVLAAGNASDQDRQFVAEAAAGGQEEVVAGRLAQAQAGSPAVREFGRWMAADHALLDQLLKMRAKEAGIDLPTAAPKPGGLDALKPLHDRQFDQAYLKEQVQDHEKVVALFQKQAQSGQNEGLKSLAQLALPLLQEHLAEAKELNTLAYATTTRASEQSVTSSAPPATTTQTTTSNAQPPMVKEMNQEAKERLEKEGK
jgi:predicted outer membrane protein